MYTWSERSSRHESEASAFIRVFVATTHNRHYLQVVILKLLERLEWAPIWHDASLDTLRLSTKLTETVGILYSSPY